MSIALTILMRSYCSPSTCFTLRKSATLLARKLSIVVADQENGGNTSSAALAARNCIVVPTNSNQPGYDIRATIGVGDNLNYIYIQAKIQIPSNNNNGKKAKAFVAKSIFFSLYDHFERMNHIKQAVDAKCVYFMFYIWAREIDDVKEELIEENMKNQLSEWIASRKNESYNDNIVNEVKCFVEEHWNLIADKVEFMWRHDLRQWLIPTLVPIPMLLEEARVTNPWNTSEDQIEI